MASALRMAISMLVLMTVLLGIAYPLAITGIAQLVFPNQANGSLVRQGDAVIGSRLIGQYFGKPEYFHPRPSAAHGLEAGGPGYDPMNSGGTNLAPSSQKLVDSVTAAVQANQADNPGAAVPGDLVTASASGLDPDISPAAAEFQVPRVAKARGIPEEAVRKAVKECTKGRTFGLFGEPRVNVLKLNLLLDSSTEK
ncbi:MAG TPA: potassium-transporting ATPase subunit KdpC [Alphaproteobacteria bacterium]|jgi:K+-transporting ATPase ATPase C chain|nr:potassium-transporting ATPase subunit KdpC [Alphaproteobacteria bacterium]